MVKRLSRIGKDVYSPEQRSGGARPACICVFCASASVIALGVGSVNAADLYRSSGGGLKDGPYVAAPLPVWTGFYAGINGGGSFGASENLRVKNSLDGTEADIGQFYRDGGFGGGQIGYNWSGFGWGNQVVLGIETDIQGSGINSGFVRNTVNYGFNPAAFTANQSIDYFCTVRGRLGYAVGNALWSMQPAALPMATSIPRLKSTPGLTF